MNLKELSQRLNLSPTTVSRALNGYPEVNAATRERVAAAAKRFNYQPNQRAIRLATGRAHAVGYVISGNMQKEIMNPIFSDFIAGAGETYSKEDIDMLLSVVSAEAEEATYRTMKAKGNVDGVILQGVRREDSRIPLLCQLKLPFVTHGRATGTELEYSWVDVNNRRAFQRATEYLLDLGHRKIALINGSANFAFSGRRQIGFMDALADRGLKPDPSHMTSGEMTELSGFIAAGKMLTAPNPPSAFLASSMLSGMGVRRAIEGLGLVMGRDVSVIIFDDDLSYLRNGLDTAIFTATRSSVREAGRISAEMLLRRIANPDSPPEQRLLEAELIIGQSTGPVPAKTAAR